MTPSAVGERQMLPVQTNRIRVGPGATVDATVDARPDATVDARPDATVDARVDARVDAHPDAMVDAHPDAGIVIEDVRHIGPSGEFAGTTDLAFGAASTIDTTALT